MRLGSGGRGDLDSKSPGDESYLALSRGYLEVLGRAQQRVDSRESDADLQRAVASRRRAAPHRAIGQVAAG